MNYKYLAQILIVFSVAILSPILTAAKGEIEKNQMALIYMTADDELNEHIHFIEATLAGFSESIDLYSVNDVKPNSLKQYDQLIFIGDEEGVLPESALKEMEAFAGQLLAFGWNADQLAQFTGWEFLREETIRSVDGNALKEIKSVIHVVPPKESEVLSKGATLDRELPLIVKKKNVSYVATSAFGTEEKFALSRSLYSLLDVPPPVSHPSYIRLEDISPISDPKLVSETGNYLADRNIPFFMAIIPVYVNSETGEQIPLSSNKELVNVLIDLQARGGMVIAHGYTHSYRFDETGEGFEFWDVQLNQPITTERNDELPLPIRARNAFSSDMDYQSYQNEILQIETNYIQYKHTKSIEDLTNIGLYPVAFEAPHYTMSSNGYKVTSDYFSSIFGQIQLSDVNWSVMDAPLFISKPAILSGMTLYPETIGYIDPALPDPFQEMEASIAKLQTVPGSVIGGFYHPYLGMEYLVEVIQLIESVPNMKWLDFSKTAQTITSDRITILQNAEGIEVQSTITEVGQFFEKAREDIVQSVLWLIVVVVVGFVATFFTYVVILRFRLKKRLFKERQYIG
ncbi:MULTISPECIES: DUF2334 domain-containing protein [unclassified Sporosarcina]|uniref:DUF2334 domain-containing protein n=1 Tax=unclassified Sporosarcina TaxID=2647733 RepID=UPI00203AB21A|nr:MULTISPECIES: DUF2334 domain-containing protein [unclassified Sporosarcina]GKV66525.1 hypothetical protein NCCP2331_26780 [Sporosarcina sp. NCCP-2331]GLB56802.1 hypothetical protein NCCP2378_25890 [Sporosarcina sp. NCCP-2378]